MASKSHSIDLTSNDDEPVRKKARTTGTSKAMSASLRASISPPRSRNAQRPATPSKPFDESGPDIAPGSIVSSPFQLTRIRDLPGTFNKDTLSLGSIVCDPLISEIWEFNYMHDLDFLMSKLDPDTKAQVKIHVVHGYWKAESGLNMKNQASKYPNINLHCAYMPEMFGTHHTKMMVLLRHDDQAQIVIHTANMIPQDWANLSQAVWMSPLLPLLSNPKASDQTFAQGSAKSPYGSGLRFKLDFLSYLRAYDNRRIICKPLIEQLQKYDFSSIRGALVGHVPGRHHLESDKSTLFGWPAIRAILKTIRVSDDGDSEIIAQVSSIATLGITNLWLQKTFFTAVSASANSASKTPKLGIVFPIAEEIRKSLDGYNSGGSIHTKIQTPAQSKQLQYLKPILYHWAGDTRPAAPSAPSPSYAAPDEVREAGRKRAAPHIKTYIRYSDRAKTRIDWALVTSANLSKQAWGEALNAGGDVRISSYELGVLVAPSMYAEDAVMVPTFKVDMPGTAIEGKTTIGCRMPYDLPLVKYGEDEEPWCATKAHEEPDWMGRSYGV